MTFDWSLPLGEAHHSEAQPNLQAFAPAFEYQASSSLYQGYQTKLNLDQNLDLCKDYISYALMYLMFYLKLHDYFYDFCSLRMSLKT